MSHRELTKQILSKMFTDKPEGTLLETASLQPEAPIEGHKNKSMLAKLETLNFLPLAAPVYKISPEIADYVFVPVPVVPTDLPNRNSVSFPYEELLKFNPKAGRPNYKTWVGKPTFEEHVNNNHEQAKGIILDTYLKPIHGTRGNLHKVMALCGFDRTKDRELANAILNGERQAYSMGAYITTYECSICGSCSRPGKLNTECGHVVRGRPEMHKMRDGSVRPSYLIARNGIEGFEVSSVGRPAWVSAINSQFFNMGN